MIADSCVLNTKCCPQGYSPKRQFIHNVPHREKANKDAGFARFQQSSVSVNSPAPEALVDKFFHDGGKKPPSGINFDLTMPPEGQAAGAAGVDEDPAGFFLAVSFLRLT